MHILLGESDTDFIHYFQTNIEPTLDDVTVIIARSGEEVLDLLSKQEFSMVMLSMTVSGLDALATAERINVEFPAMQLALLFSKATRFFPKRMLVIRAKAYISKQATNQEFSDAINFCSKGERFICNGISKAIALMCMPDAEPSPLDALSSREMQVLLSLTLGVPVRDISLSLQLSPKTVSTYKCRIREKLQLTTTQEMRKVALENGLI